MNKIKFGAASLAVLGLFAFTSCSGKKGKNIEIKLAHNLNEQHSVHIALTDFANRVSAKSDGEITIQIYPNGQLGGEAEELEQLKVGALGMTKVSAAALTTYSEGYNAFTLPYVFANEAHYYKCMESDAVKRLYTSTDGIGFRGLTFYDSGARNFYTKNRPILKPSDLNGLKIRVMGYQSQTDMVRAMGGTPISMSFGEVYTALQSGVIDGTENNETALTVGGRHGEVCKHYSFDEHTRIPDILVVSTKVWNSLTPQQQNIIQEAALESTEYHKGLWKASVEEAKKEAAEKMNVQFYEVDKAPFRAAVAPVVQGYTSSMADVKSLVEAFAALE
ncbi:TRAP transporter substrate-binding protein [Treponema pectinovorum]|uniref:TRAP transporter substrate-binding protein n=1 Tax=Treponema pectinovorum TaxID=164 RepID=UPI0011F1951D|nr:TRAP transporter substrate-binding protein [Treponema pectinovorum]